MNRAVFSFNRGADKVLLRPLAKGYQTITPTPVRRGIGNFFANLESPVVIVGNLLQGKPKQAGVEVGRFLINSTAGIGGLIDVASSAGLNRVDDDFGQTLAVWGVPEGAYVMVPFLGPYSVRHGFGALLDLPFQLLFQYNNSEIRDKLTILYVIDLREGLLAADDALDSAIDPYVFLRNAYRQRRNFLVYDGDPPIEEEEFEDEEFSEEDFLGE